MAEHSSSTAGRAERNVFYAIGQHRALGFVPWAIDSPFPERHGPPLVDPLGGQWGAQAYWLRDSYVAIARAMEPIVDAQGAGRGMVLRRSANEYLLIGVGFQARFRTPRPSGRPIPIRFAEWGYFDRDRWVVQHPMRRERPESLGSPVTLLEPGVARIVLDL